MTDWLEVARRELAAPLDRKEVSSVSSVGELGAFKKSESFRLHRPAAYDVEVPLGVSDDALPLEDDDNAKAHTASPAKIAETPFSSILAVGDNGSVDESLPDDHSEDENAAVASPPTEKPSKNEKGPDEELPKLTKSLAADVRDRAVRVWIIDHFRGAPLGRCIQCGETAGQGYPLFVMAAGDDVAGVHERCRALWWDRQEALAREALGFGAP
jgi:hypothetical protein